MKNNYFFAPVVLVVVVVVTCFGQFVSQFYNVLINSTQINLIVYKEFAKFKLHLQLKIIYNLKKKNISLS